MSQYREIAGSSATWIEIDGRVIDQYEAVRTHNTLEWHALCIARNETKAAAVARARMAEAA